MQITIISAGNTARGIPTRALAGRHTVQIIDRAPDKAARLAADRFLGRAARHPAAAISRTWPCHESNQRWFVPYDFARPYGIDKSAPPNILGGHWGAARTS